jgi:hypothetical protein
MVGRGDVHRESGIATPSLRTQLADTDRVVEVEQASRQAPDGVVVHWYPHPE